MVGGGEMAENLVGCETPSAASSLIFVSAAVVTATTMAAQTTRRHPDPQHLPLSGGVEVKTMELVGKLRPG